MVAVDASVEVAYVASLIRALGEHRGPAVLSFSPHVRVYLASQRVEMRCGHDGLFAIVKSWDLDPFSGHLFAFIGKRADRAKILPHRSPRTRTTCL